MFIWHLLESRYRIQRTPFCVFFSVHLLQELASLSLLSLDSVTVKNPCAPWSLQQRNSCPYLRSLSSSSAMYFRAFSFTLISAKQKPKVAAIVLKDWTKPRSTQLKAPNQNRSQADSKDHILGWESTQIRQGGCQEWGAGDALRPPEPLLEPEPSLRCAFKGSSLDVGHGRHCALCLSPFPPGSQELGGREWKNRSEWETTPILRMNHKKLTRRRRGLQTPSLRHTWKCDPDRTCLGWVDINVSASKAGRSAASRDKLRAS